MPERTEYHAPGQPAREKRYRQGDRMPDKMNALFDRWRGPIVFIFPIVAAIAVSLGYQYVSPNDRLDLQAQSLDLMTLRIERQEARLMATDSSVKAINTKLDLLVDLACQRLTSDQKLVTRRVVECAK